MASRPALANRSMLALSGCALLAAAAGAARWGGHDVLRAGLRHVERAGHGYVALAGLLGTVAGLWLLAAQLPRRAPRRLRLAAPGCSLDRRAVRRAVRTGCSTVPGVVRARSRLTRDGRSLGLSLTLRIACGTDPGTVLAHVSTVVLPPVEALLGPRPPRTRILLTVARPKARRTT
ncbi:hypothetical protein [Streptomyces sp. NPDC004435]|uniref:hypothetical protein n=1 Tax=Streptomyces sp. NPDC004435 TaxID=3364701 RepID=UPI0036B738F9